MVFQYDLSKTLHRPALGKLRASPKLLPRFRPRFHGAYQQSAAAFRAWPFGCRITSALEVLHVLAVGGERWCAAAGLQGVQHALGASAQHGLQTRAGHNGVAQREAVAPDGVVHGKKVGGPGVQGCVGQDQVCDFIDAAGREPHQGATIDESGRTLDRKSVV